MGNFFPPPCGQLRVHLCRHARGILFRCFGFGCPGAICAVASCVWPKWSGALRIGYVASLATKLSDTFASEIGKVCMSALSTFGTFGTMSCYTEEATG